MATSPGENYLPTKLEMTEGIDYYLRRPGAVVLATGLAKQPKSKDRGVTHFAWVDRIKLRTEADGLLYLDYSKDGVLLATQTVYEARCLPPSTRSISLEINALLPLTWKGSR